MLLRARGNAVPSNLKHALECLMQFGRDVFPTLCTGMAYRLLLTIGFSIASGEKSFSKLKLIKTCMRSSMLQESLTSSALISIEKEFLSADVKNEVVQIGQVTWEREIVKCKRLIDLFTLSPVLV